LVLFGVFSFWTSCWNYGVGVPSGLFVPSLLTGAVFGRIVGQIVNYLNVDALLGQQWASPGIYALVGACAMLAGTARITISLAMILMETSGDSEFGLPIFLAVMTAKWMGDCFNRGIYDLHIVELKKVPLLEPLPEREMMLKQVSEVMTKDVCTLELLETVEHLVETLGSTNHHAFPVLYPGTNRMAGVLSQSMMRRILELGSVNGAFQDPDHPVMDRRLSSRASKKFIPYEDMRETVDYLYQTPLEVREAVKSDLHKKVDLRPYINRNGLTVSKYASLWSCYTLFRQLGLRHLPVVGHEGQICGIITRKDLILVEEEEEDAEEDSAVDDMDDEADTDEGCSPFVPSRELDEEFDEDLDLVPSRTQTRILEPGMGNMGGVAGM